MSDSNKSYYIINSSPLVGFEAFIHKARRLATRSRKVSKARDKVLKSLYRCETWQVPRQHCCRDTCQISQRSHNSKHKSHTSDFLQNLIIRCLSRYWNSLKSSTTKDRPSCELSWQIEFPSCFVLLQKSPVCYDRINPRHDIAFLQMPSSPLSDKRGFINTFDWYPKPFNR